MATTFETTMMMTSTVVEPDTEMPSEAQLGLLIVIWCVVLVVLALASVLGNVVVLGTLRYAWTTVGAKPGNFLAFMLAIADLLNTVVNLPIVVAGVIFGQWHDSSRIRMAHFFFLILLSGASNMILCVISINRYAMVAKPNTNEKVGRRRARNLSLYVWCHALVAAIACIVTWVVVEETGDQLQLHSLVPPTASQIVGYALVVVAPMAVMTFTYMRLFRRVKMRTRAVGARKCNVPSTVSQIAASQSVLQDGPSVFGAVKPHNMILARPTKQNRRHADLSTAVTLLILLGIFVLCWTPIMVLTLLVSSRSLHDNDSSPTYLTVAAAIVFVIPACNPLVYSLRNAQFRAAATDFLTATWKRVSAPCRRKGGTLERAEGNPEIVARSDFI